MARLASNATTIANARQYGRTIYDLAVRRELITVGEEMIADSFEAEIDENPASLIDKAEQSLYEIAEKGAHSSGFMPFEESLAGAIEMAERAYQREGHLSGISPAFAGSTTCWAGFRKATSSFWPDAPAWAKPRWQRMSPFQLPMTI